MAEEKEAAAQVTFWGRVGAAAVAVLPYAIAAILWAAQLQADVKDLRDWKAGAGSYEPRITALETKAMAAAPGVIDLQARMGALEKGLETQAQSLRRIEQYLLEQATRDRGEQVTMKETRGIRNHNPGNIEHQPANRWQGLASPPSDGRFCRFTEPAYGIRALARILITYQDKAKAADGSAVDTITEVIHRWAPPHENNVGAYIASVCKRTGKRPDAALDLHSYEDLRPVVEAIIQHENGSMPYSRAVIDRGLVLAGVQPPQRQALATREGFGGLTASIGTPTAGAVEIVQQATDQLSPLAYYLDVAKYALLGLTLIGVGLMVWGFIDRKRRGLA